MNKLLIFALALALPLLSTAQSSQINSFIDQHSGKKGFTTINISPDMFKLIALMGLESEDELVTDAIAMAEKLESVRVLVYEGEGDADPKKLFSAANKTLQGNYTELVTVEGEENVRFLIKSAREGFIDELAVIVSEADEFVFVSVIGEIELAKLAAIAKKAQIDGLEHLRALEDIEHEHEDVR